MTLGLPLLSIIRNAVEWLADANVNVTLLLSSEKNVFNGDTECYSSGKSAVRDNTSVLLTLTCKRFSPVPNVAQANEIESAPALSNVVQRDTEN